MGGRKGFTGPWTCSTEQVGGEERPTLEASKLEAVGDVTPSLKRLVGGFKLSGLKLGGFQLWP